MYMSQRKRNGTVIYLDMNVNCKMNTVSNFYVMNIPGSIMF